MTTALVAYRPKPTIMERFKKRMAYWAWLVGITNYKD